MKEKCPVCDGHGMIVVMRGNDPQTEDDLPCTACGNTGYMKGSRARSLRMSSHKIRESILARRFGASAHRWNVR